jgi:predicted RNA-binding protein with RPS1 domain
MSNYTKGKIVQGTVTGIETYGIFVSLDEYYSGLIHISEVSHNFVRDIHDYVKIGDTINVEIIGVDSENFHLKLSIKNINYKNNIKLRRKKIIETPLGFKTLSYKLPIWVDEKLKKI